MTQPLRLMKKVRCEDCVHFKRAPYQARIDGCYHKDNMVAKQGASYLDEQQIAGDHRKINLRGDCAQYEAKPARPSVWQRLLGA